VAGQGRLGSALGFGEAFSLTLAKHGCVVLQLVVRGFFSRRKEEPMKRIDRRSAIALGAVIVATPILPAAAQTQGPMYGPNDGKEVAPGVRQVDLGEGPATIPGYKTVMLRDIVMQPNSKTTDRPMPNAMVCHMADGELELLKDGKTIAAHRNQVWTCSKDSHEVATNKTNRVAIMRITDLMA